MIFYEPSSYQSRSDSYQPTKQGLQRRKRFTERWERRNRSYTARDLLSIAVEMVQLNSEKAPSVRRLARNVSVGRGGRGGGVQFEASGTEEQTERASVESDGKRTIVYKSESLSALCELEQESTIWFAGDGL